MKTKSNSKKKQIILFFIWSLTGIISINAQTKTTEEILQGFVESYKKDHMAHTITFGVLVGEDWWHVISERKQEGYKVGKQNQYTFHNFSPHEVILHQGNQIYQLGISILPTKMFWIR